MSMKSIVTTLLVLACAIAVPCSFAQEYMLYLDQTPAQGGAVSPGTGKVHAYGSGQQVTLTAEPAQGYQFLYWLGAVSDTSKATTSISVDGPRYVVAVFEKAEFDDPQGMLSTYAGAGAGEGSSGLRGSNKMITGMGVDGSNPVVTKYNPVYNYDLGGGDPGDNTDPTDPDLPVPDPDDPTTPEPATMFMLGMGSLGLLMKRKK